MPAYIPKNANDFIEAQLDARIRSVGRSFEADVLAFSGSLIGGVDDLVRHVVEAMRARSASHQKLQVIITTGGGYIEVVQRIVDTLRHHYEVVEFIVPNYAFSAGTVLVMSGDAIHMNYYSRLGPIDPQVELSSGRMVPALGYLLQWERLLEKARQGTLTTAEAQLMIDGFDQAALYQYEQARELSVALLKQWLATYKFKNWTETAERHLPVDDAMKVQRAEEIARILNDPERWHSHGHGISMEVLRKDLNLLIDDYDQDQAKGGKIKEYHGLLDDYMKKRGETGVLHTAGMYVPFM